MNKIITSILLTAILLFLLLAACVDNDKQGNTGAVLSYERTPIPEGYEIITSSANATATYGADQFFLQLTAIANDGQ